MRVRSFHISSIRSARSVSRAPARSTDAVHDAEHTLPGERGDAVNAILAAAGYNFSLLIRWFRGLLRLLAALIGIGQDQSQPDNRALLAAD